MEKSIKVQIFGHEATGLFVAKSSDVQGFYVHGRSIDDIRQNISAALESYFDARGQSFEITTITDDDTLPAGFFPRDIVAQGSLRAA